MTQKLQTLAPTLMQKLLGRNYKWWYVIEYNFKLSLAESWSAIFIILRDFLPLVISITIYSNFSQSNEFLEYFLIGNFLYKMYTLFADIAWEVSSDIYYGTLTNRLLTPSNYKLFHIFSCVGGNLYTTFTNLLILFTLFQIC